MKALKLIVDPNLVWSRDAQLSHNDQLGLIDYIDPAFDFFKYGRDFLNGQFWSTAQSTALTALVGEEAGAALSDPAIGVALEINRLTRPDAAERSVMALFFTAFGMVDSGLGYGLSDFPHAYAVNSFVDDFVGRPINPAGIGVAAVKGMIWRFAEKLERPVSTIRYARGSAAPGEIAPGSSQFSAACFVVPTTSAVLTRSSFSPLAEFLASATSCADGSVA
jgi:hypothetical protein